MSTTELDLTPKQQTSEAIRQAETILITTGQRPTVDQVASVLALAAILRKFGKKVSAIISDQLPGPAQWLDRGGLDTKLSGMRDFILKVKTDKVEVDSLRYEPDGDHLNIFITPFKGGFAPSDVTFGYGDYHYDLAIVLGVAQKSRIDKIYGENMSLFGNIPLINIDYHRVNENFGAVNLVDPAASSISEMLVATSESLQTGLIDAPIATIMLGGIMAATDRFTALHTTSKSLTVAAQMMAAGADQPAVVRGLYGERSRDNNTTQTPRDGGRTRSDGAAGPFPARTPNPAPAQPQAAAMVMAPTPAVEPVRLEADSESAPTEMTLPRDEQTQPESTPVQPLIEPDHIEFMRAEMAHDESAAEELTPTETANIVPMADFTAAAEILRAREAE